jgi:hypothetical protein
MSSREKCLASLTKILFKKQCREMYKAELVHKTNGSLLTLIRMTKDEKGLAFFKGLLL